MGASPEDFEIDVDPAFQEKFWFVERIGWLAMALIILAALAGFTGTSGPASSGQAQAGGAVVNYPRIARWQTADALSVELPREPTGRAQLLLPAAFTEQFAIESITPQPSSVVATAEGVRFTFDLAPEPGRKWIRFEVRAGSPSLPHTMRGRINGEPFDFATVVLP